MTEFIGVGVAVATLLALLLVGIPVTFALLASSLVAFLLFLPPEQITVIGSVMWGTLNEPVLATIPLFVLMGEFFARSRMSQNTYDGMSVLVRRIPGGLWHSNILAGSMFAAASGSSVGTAAALGRAAAPQLHVRNYPRNLTYGSLVAGGTLGILIPPSLAFILYGTLTGTSIGRLFIAGILPGIALAAMFSILLWAASITVFRDRMPERGTDTSTYRDLLRIIPLAVVVGWVMVSLYFGLATPTESGAVGAIGMLIVVWIMWKPSLSHFLESLKATVATSGMLLTILMSSALLSYVFAVSGISNAISDLIANLSVSRYVVLLVIGLILFVLGMFLDPISLLALTMPIIFPISQDLGFDSIWFAVFIVVLLEVGLITPPVGLNLFVIRGVDSTAEWRDLIVGAAPFVIVMLLFAVILTVVPGLATWLPSRM